MQIPYWGDGQHHFAIIKPDVKLNTHLSIKLCHSTKLQLV